VRLLDNKVLYSNILFPLFEAHCEPYAMPVLTLRGSYFAWTVFRMIITINREFFFIQHWLLRSNQTVFCLNYELILFRNANQFSFSKG